MSFFWLRSLPRYWGLIPSSLGKHAPAIGGLTGVVTQWKWGWIIMQKRWKLFAYFLYICESLCIFALKLLYAPSQAIRDEIERTQLEQVWMEWFGECVCAWKALGGCVLSGPLCFKGFGLGLRRNRSLRRRAYGEELTRRRGGTEA